MPLNIKDLAISSPDIAPLTTIAAEFAADGGNRIPAIEISGVPESARELAIILHDPDAPLANGFTHLTVYGLRPEAQVVDFDEARFGPHGGGVPGYTGPEPPFGHGRHHYYFWVYALDCEVEGAPSREAFLAAYADRVIEQNRFVAYYER